MEIDGNRRDAIAIHAAMERLSAMVITEHVTTPELREMASWLEARFEAAKCTLRFQGPDAPMIGWRSIV